MYTEDSRVSLSTALNLGESGRYNHFPLAAGLSTALDLAESGRYNHFPHWLGGGPSGAKNKSVRQLSQFEASEGTTGVSLYTYCTLYSIRHRGEWVW